MLSFISIASYCLVAKAVLDKPMITNPYSMLVNVEELLISDLLLSKRELHPSLMH